MTALTIATDSVDIATPYFAPDEALFESTMMHTKAAIVDERWSIIGSPNSDNRSFELNDEIVPVCDATALDAALRDAFEADLARANRPDEYERGLVDRLRGARCHVLLALRLDGHAPMRTPRAGSIDVRSVAVTAPLDPRYFSCAPAGILRQERAREGGSRLACRGSKHGSVHGA